MAVKTITVTTDAYETLKAMKASGESFSDTLLRVGAKRSLLDFAGCISEESAKEMMQTIKDLRKETAKSFERRTKRIQDAFDNGSA